MVFHTLAPSFRFFHPYTIPFSGRYFLVLIDCLVVSLLCTFELLLLPSDLASFNNADDSSRQLNRLYEHCMSCRASRAGWLDICLYSQSCDLSTISESRTDEMLRMWMEISHCEEQTIIDTAIKPLTQERYISCVPVCLESL